MNAIQLLLLAIVAYYGFQKLQKPAAPKTSTPPNPKPTEQTPPPVVPSSPVTDPPVNPPPPPTEPPVNPPPPNNWNTALVGYFYGGDYHTLAAEQPGGVADFRFYGQGLAYPSPRTSLSFAPDGDLRVFALPSHSITVPETLRQQGVVSAIHYKITDIATGQLVHECFDTKGGMALQSRFNNHPDNCKRWIKTGNYLLWAKNVSSSNVLQHWWLCMNNIDITLHEQNLLPNQELYVPFTVSDVNSNWYKLNCNAEVEA